jgi:hypothetical protein
MNKVIFTPNVGEGEKLSVNSEGRESKPYESVKLTTLHCNSWP